MDNTAFGLAGRVSLLTLASTVIAAMACGDPTSTDERVEEEPFTEPPFVGEYTLSEAGGGPLPYVNVFPLCTQAIRAGSLALRTDRRQLVFEVRTTVRQDCPGPGPTLEFSRQSSGTWAVFGDSIRFLRLRPDNGQLEELARGRADGSSVAVRGLATSPNTVEEVYRRN